MNFQAFWAALTAAFAENALWYAAFALPFFAIFGVLGKRFFKKIRIQQVERANWTHFTHDVGYSVVTFLVFACMDVAFYRLSDLGYTQIYFGNEYGWVWLFLSLGVVLFIDDAFFYWSHRAMHTPALYKFFHRVHHQSTDPSPLTAFAFHPSEAIVEQLMHIVLPFVLPLNFGVIITWQVISMLNNVLGHLGYEVYPKGWVKWPILRYITTSTHHNMHHQLFNGNYALYFTWWDKWMGTEFKDYEMRHTQIFERAQYPQTTEGLYRLRVAAVHDEANDAFTVRFADVPTVFRDFSAGQHVTVKVNIDGTPYYRTFSLSSAPNVDYTATLTIKKIAGGKVTNYLYQHLKAGDTLEVTAPSGQFCLSPEPANQNHYVMVAGGSGITPIFSMMKTVLRLEPKSKITLLYANRSHQSVIFDDAIKQLQTDFPQQLSVQHFFSDGPSVSNASKGHITKEHLEALLNQKDKRPMVFYLCGPEMMTHKIAADLVYLGVDKSHVHRELFLINAQSVSNNSVKARVNATIFGKTYQFETDGQQTILQNALAQNVPLPYSCQSGLCGTCKMKCTEGSVTMLNNQALSEAEIADGYVLTCQSLPKTSKINLKYA